jgi:hypothetical protein
MRVFDRDLIRGGHYGQRSCEPHLKAEHIAAPTNAANLKKALANSEPSTHGTSRQLSQCNIMLEEERKLLDPLPMTKELASNHGPVSDGGPSQNPF